MPRQARLVSMLVATVALGASVGTQTPTQVTSTLGPTFDVVSIKRTPPGTLSRGVPLVRPDGGLSLTGTTVEGLVRLAHPPLAERPSRIVGLPDWAKRDQYNLTATASLPKFTSDALTAMLRAMLVDRLNMVAHVEVGDVDVYDLLLAHGDGRLGSGMAPIAADCAAKLAADRAAAEAALALGTPPSLPSRLDRTEPPAPCSLRMVGDPLRKSDRLEGEAPMSALVRMLQIPLSRRVVDKTGLTGSYRVNMLFNMRATLLSPDAGADVDAAPSVFTAVREQLGLKLEASKAEGDVLVIDRISPPTEN